MSTFIMARFVGPGPIGDFAIAVGVGAVLGQLVETGAAAGLVHRKQISAATTWTHAQVQIVSAVIRLLGALIVLPLVSSLFGAGVAELLLGLSLIQVIWAIGLTPRVLMERRLDFRRIAFIDGVALLLSSFAGIAAAAAGWGRYALLIGGTEPALILCAAQALGSLAAGPHQKKTRPISRREIRWFFGFARGFWVQAQFVPILLHWDRLVIGYFFGAVSAGLYDLAGRIAFLPVRLVMQFIGRVMLPFYSQIQTDIHRIGDLLRQQLQAVAYLVVLFFVVFVIADSAGAIRLLLGDAWQPVGQLVLALSVVGWLRAAFFTLWPAILGTGQTWVFVRYNVAIAVPTLIALPLLAPTYGLAGVVIGVTSATAMGTAVLLRTMDPPWVGAPKTVPLLLLIPSFGLLFMLFATLVLPPAAAWIVGLVAGAIWIGSLARQKSSVLHLLNLVRRS